jgi:hypothetical protein
MIGFAYPTSPHTRRHGPDGYKTYEPFRDWLRDEFMFRCVYCLHREQWYSRSGTFSIEHFIPVSIDPSVEREYSNLLYACVTCNNAKRAILDVPNPCLVAFGDCLRVTRSGEIEPLNSDGEKLVAVLLLNSDSNLVQRSRWIRTLTALKASHPDLFNEYMGFPEDLPDLRTRRTKNTKPDGALNCYFAQRERGKLPATY